MSPSEYHYHHHHVEDELVSISISQPQCFVTDTISLQTKRNRAVHEKLQLLRADEAVALADTAAVKRRQRKKNETFWFFTSKEISRYLGYLVKTWSRSLSR